jgi:hypothetical protein
MAFASFLQLRRLRSSETVIKKAAGQGISGDDRNLVEFPVGHSASNDTVPMRIMRPPTAATVTSSDDARVPVRWPPFPIVFYTLQQFFNQPCSRCE